RRDTLASGSGRLEVWQNAWELAKERPYFGYGYGTVGTLFERGAFNSAITEFQGGDLHNSYLEVLLDLGWIGITSFILLVTVIFFVAIRAMIRHRDSPAYSFVVMLVASLIAGVSSAIFESWLIAPGSIFSFPFWFFVVMLLQFARMPAQGKEVAT